MPKDLPGLYWDPERNRYFPISSRPSGAPVSAPPPPQTTSQGVRGKKRKFETRAASTSRRGDGGGEEDTGPSKASIAHAKRKAHPLALAHSSVVQQPWDWLTRERNMRTLQLSNIGATSRLSYNHAGTFGKITTFCTYRSEDTNPNDADSWHLLGDTRGWLFRCKASYRDHDTEEPSRLDADVDVELDWLPWSAELNLQPDGLVSSIIRLDAERLTRRFRATGAGSSARFASSDIKSLDRMFIVTLPGARDLWASDLRERSVAFGASFRAIYIPDIDHSTSPEQLNTHSDVFTIAQDQNLIYTGARNGAIHRFDKRVGFKNRGDLLLDSRFSGENTRSSVLNLSLLGTMGDDPAFSNHTSSCRLMESGLFVSQMNGQLQTYDLRFVTSRQWSGSRGVEPVVIYKGHVNNHTRELGLAIDPTHGTVYAAGQDCRIRGWSLFSGQAITPPFASSLFAPTLLAPLSSPFNSIFTSEALSSFPTLSSSRPSVPSSRPSNPTTPHPAVSTPPSPWMHLNPFATTFQEPVPVLCISADDSGAGRSSEAGSTCLWGACGKDLWRWNLGQRTGVPVGI